MSGTEARSGAFDRSVAFAEALFRRLAEATAAETGAGVTRPPYGAGEQAAHDLMAGAARDLGMETRVDIAGNLHMTLAGKNRDAARWLTGSHLDAVPYGGNFDGAAGVVAGLTAAHAMRQAGLRPDADLTVIAFRGEEGSSWFAGPHKSHFGSRALLGQLSAQEMSAAVAFGDGRTLAGMMRDAGFDPAAIDLGRRHLQSRQVRGFVEVHIEQGPVLVERRLPIALVSGIRGTLRARNCRSIGAYAHSGAVPREYRQDALLAAVDLVGRIEQAWEGWLAGGRDAVCTIGRFFTDPDRHSLTKVPGEVRFTIDIRSEEALLLAEAATFIQGAAEAVGARRGVVLDLGPLDVSPPAVMSPDLLAALAHAAAGMGITPPVMASGAGHDAANFAAAGIPTAMIFIRNDRGSHNPDEAMDMADFGLAAKLLTRLVTRQG